MSQKNLGSKNILGQQDVWFKKLLDPNQILGQENSNSKKFGYKKKGLNISSPEIFGSKIFLSSKKYRSKRVLGP